MEALDEQLRHKMIEKTLSIFKKHRSLFYKRNVVLPLLSYYIYCTRNFRRFFIQMEVLLSDR